MLDNYSYALLKASNLLFDDAVSKKFTVSDLDNNHQASIIRISIYFTIYLAYRSMLKVHKDSADGIVGFVFNYLNLVHLNIQKKRLAEGKQVQDASAYTREEYNELRQQLDKCAEIFPPFDIKDENEWVKLYLSSAIGWYSFYVADACGIKGDDYLSWVKTEKNILGSFWGLVGITAEAIEKASIDLLVALNEDHKNT